MEPQPQAQPQPQLKIGNAIKFTKKGGTVSIKAEIV